MYARVINDSFIYDFENMQFKDEILRKTVENVHIHDRDIKTQYSAHRQQMQLFTIGKRFVTIYWDSLRNKVSYEFTHWNIIDKT